MSSVAPKVKNFLLIPGFMCDDSLWKSILPRMEEIGQIYLADLNQGTTIEAMATRIIATMPDNCIVFGFSLGGYVAREIALGAPHKVARLILLNTSSRASTNEELKYNQQLISISKNANFKGQPLRAFQRTLHPDHQNQPELLAQLQAMSLRLGTEVFQRQLGLIRIDGTSSLARISCPTLVIASRNDQMRTLEESEILSNGIPAATMHIIENCGHMSVLEKPLEVLAVIEHWLEIDSQ